MGSGVSHHSFARYREELHRHEDRHHAMAVALRRVAPAIVASAATVAVALLCLTAARMNNTRGLGPVGVVLSALQSELGGARGASATLGHFVSRSQRQRHLIRPKHLQQSAGDDLVDGRRAN